MTLFWKIYAVALALLISEVALAQTVPPPPSVPPVPPAPTATGKVKITRKIIGPAETPTAQPVSPIPPSPIPGQINVPKKPAIAVPPPPVNPLTTPVKRPVDAKKIPAAPVAPPTAPTAPEKIDIQPKTPVAPVAPVPPSPTPGKAKGGAVPPTVPAAPNGKKSPVPPAPVKTPPFTVTPAVPQPPNVASPVSPQPPVDPSERIRNSQPPTGGLPTDVGGNKKYPIVPPIHRPQPNPNPNKNTIPAPPIVGGKKTEAPPSIPARQQKVNSAWVVRVEIHSKATHLIASNKKAEFRVLCQSLKMQSPAGVIQAEGGVRVVVAGLDITCNKLTISWDQEWVTMDGGVRLETNNDKQKVILAGEQLRLKLDTLTGGNAEKAAGQIIPVQKTDERPVPPVKNNTRRFGGKSLFPQTPQTQERTPFAPEYQGPPPTPQRRFYRGERRN